MSQQYVTGVRPKVSRDNLSCKFEATFQIGRSMQRQQSPSTSYNSAASIVVAILALLLIPTSESFAQPVSPSRGLMIRPIWKSEQDTPIGSPALGEFGGWGSVFHGFNSANDAYGWAIDIGLAIELKRWSEKSSLMILSSMELSANTHNSIYFHPKGGIWEEGLLFTHQTDNYDWQLGYLHRCRHDIDNGELTDFTGIPPERTLIYSSFVSRFYFNPIYLEDYVSMHGPSNEEREHLQQIKPWVAADLYAFREDYRQPDSAIGVPPNYKNILFTISTGAKWTIAKFGPGIIYARGGIGLTAFGTDGTYFKTFSKITSTSIDGNLEFGATSEGKAAVFDIFVGYQGMDDDTERQVPQSSHFFLVGIRLRGSSLVE